MNECVQTLAAMGGNGNEHSSVQVLQCDWQQMYLPCMGLSSHLEGVPFFIYIYMTFVNLQVGTGTFQSSGMHTAQSPVPVTVVGHR